MDRAYVDFRRLYRMHQSGAFFVTRAKKRFDCRRVYSQRVDKKSGLQCDQIVVLNNPIPKRGIPSGFAECATTTLPVKNGWCFSPTIFFCPLSRSLSSIGVVGKWNCSFDGSNSICGSKLSMAPRKTRSEPKFGLLLRCMCWLPLSKND